MLDCLEEMFYSLATEDKKGRRREMITEEMFKSATGFDPVEDDLERCNCQKAGEVGHWYCGWNPDKNQPAFCGSLDQDKIKCGYYRVQEK